MYPSTVGGPTESFSGCRSGHLWFVSRMEELRVDLDKACKSLEVEQDVQELATKMLDRCFTPAGETLQTAQVRCHPLSDVSKVA